MRTDSTDRQILPKITEPLADLARVRIAWRVKPVRGSARSYRELLSSSLALAHQLTIENRRLHDRIAALIDEIRAARGSTHAADRPDPR